jgi:phosphatidylinositol glycan class U
MPVDRRKAAVFGGAFVLRLLLLLLFPSLPDLLTGRVEVSTPVNSFKRRKFYTSISPVCLECSG